MNLTQIYRLYIIGLVAMMLIFVSLNPLTNSDFHMKNDEGYYYKYANSEVLHGKKVFHRLINWYADNSEARNHPSPLRVGYILLIAVLFKSFGFPSFYIMALISTLSFIIFLFVGFHYVRKYFDLDTALLTLLFLSSSPLLLGLSRRGLIDSSANLLWTLAMWLFLDVLSRPGLYSYIFFLLTLMIAITFKEATLILIPFFTIAGIIGQRNGAMIKNYQIGGIVIFPLISLSIFYAWIYGGFGVFQAAILGITKTHFISNYPNPYAFNYCSGPWFRYLLDFLLLIPIELLLFIGYTGYLCVNRKALDLKRTYLVLYFVYVYSVLNSLAHSKVIRFVASLEMVIALFAVLMLVELFKGLKDNKGRVILIYCSFSILISNWSCFMNIVYKTALLDPISFSLLMYRHFFPMLK